MKITNPITLDVARSNSYICLLAKQFDENSRFLIATLTNNGAPMIIPAGAAVTLRATRPDGEPVAVPGIINNDGTTTVEIDDYILEVVGSASLSIEVAIGDEILTSASFNLTIQRADGNGWLRVYVAAASLAAGNYYITIGDTPYAFTTTQTIPAGGAIYFNSDGGTAQTRDASGNVLDASLTLTAGTSGTELTSDVPTMSFLTAIAGRMATIEAEMSQKANIDGSYPLLGAGTADNLMTDNGATQAIPFIQEGTGKGNGEATVKVGGVLQLKKKLGNTVCVNQLIPDSTSHNTGTGTGNWAGLADNMSMISGHHYAILISGEIPVGSQFRIRDSVKGWVGTAHSGSFVWTAPDNSTSTTTVQFQYPSGEAYDAYRRTIDLDLWFGSSASIPSHLLSHPEDRGRYFAGSLSHDAGHLENADGTVMRSVGRNVWDEEWEYGTINTTTGAKESSTTRIRSKNYIPVSPNTECYVYGVDVGAATGRACFYDADKNFVGGMSDFPVSAGNKKFTPPSNAHFMLFSPPTSYGTTYGQNITLSRFYTGESGYDQYYPYTVLAEVDTGSEGLCGDGTPEHSDSKVPDGTITRRRKRIDLGTLGYNSPTASGRVNSTSVPTDAPAYAYGENGIPPLVSGRYASISKKQWYNASAVGITICGEGYGTNGYIGIVDPSFVGKTAEQVATALSGIYLEYDLATPTTEQGTAFAENIPCDPDGTLNWTQSAGVPQGNEIFYPADLKGALDSIVAALPSANGTYTLHATVTTAGVTFSWS